MLVLEAPSQARDEQGHGHDLAGRSVVGVDLSKRDDQVRETFPRPEKFRFEPVDFRIP